VANLLFDKIHLEWWSEAKLKAALLKRKAELRVKKSSLEF